MSTTDDLQLFSRHPARHGRYPEWIDWVLGAIAVLVGMLAIVVGSALAFVVDRTLLAAGLEEAEPIVVATRELTDAEALELMAAVVEWTGIGVLVTGIGLVLAGLWYGWRRRRSRRGAAPIDSYWGFAVLGAFATAFLSFLPLSPILGGLLAGYLERAESERTVSVGALAGVLPIVPVAVIMAFVFVGLIDGLLAVDAVGVAIFSGATMVFAVTLTAVIAAGLGAAGGFIGGWLAEWQAGEETTAPARE